MELNRLKKPQNITLIFLFALVSVFFALHFSLFKRGTLYITEKFTIDDTFYYLRCAWNLKNLGFVTFDGIHSTNGVQFLWFLILYIIALFSSSKIVLLNSTIMACISLTSLCYFVIWKIACILKRPLLASVMIGGWAVYSFPIKLFSMGMENSIHALIFWCIIWQVLRFLLEAGEKKKRIFATITVLLILNTWTRLDSSIFSVVIYFFCIGVLAHESKNLGSFIKNYKQPVVIMSALAISAFAIQLVFFKTAGDSFLPISMLVKQFHSSFLNYSFLEKIALHFRQSYMQWNLFDTGFLFFVHLLALLCMIICLYLWRRGFWKQLIRKTDNALFNSWGCLFIGFIFYNLISSLIITGSDFFTWYRAPLYIFWIFTFFSLSVFVELIFPYNYFKKVFKSLLIIGNLLIILFSLHYYVKNFCLGPKIVQDKYNARHKAIMWISENVPSDTVIASMESGQLGYFLDNTVINLDGLVNSYDYYKNVLLKGNVAIKKYLIENNVGYIVHNTRYPPIADFPLVKSYNFRSIDGYEQIEIRRVSK